MKKRFPVLCLLALGFSGLYATSVQAEEPASLTGSLALTSDYAFRGLTQTNRDPALQGGLEYASASGFYVGTWGSNISWLSDGQDSVSSSLEVDGYGGYRGTWGDAVSYDVGLLYYWYPGSYPAGFTDPDTLEGYFSIGWSIFTLKYSHAFTDLFGIDGARRLAVYHHHHNHHHDLHGAVVPDLPLPSASGGEGSHRPFVEQDHG